MSYANAGLICLMNTSINSVWQLKTVDALGDVVGAGYITGASTAGSGKGTPGRGMKIGDSVRVIVVNDIAAAAPTISASAWATVTAINSSTGAATIVLDFDDDDS